MLLKATSPIDYYGLILLSLFRMILKAWKLPVSVFYLIPDTTVYRQNLIVGTDSVGRSFRCIGLVLSMLFFGKT